MNLTNDQRFQFVFRQPLLQVNQCPQQTVERRTLNRVIDAFLAAHQTTLRERAAEACQHVDVSAFQISRIPVLLPLIVYAESPTPEIVLDLLDVMLECTWCWIVIVTVSQVTEMLC